ncbi:MAG: TlpA disulfide reductase family protein [Pseudomonadales bacterium]|jgi:peroxiredoxin|nr:TlpA disulfide reductase family protein [Pseudomonadales bacterium]
MRRTATVLSSVLLVLVAQVATASEPAAVGVPLPAFVLERLDGGELSEADLAGRPALVVFFDTACPYCKRLAPGIERTWQRYGEQGLQVLAISFREEGNVQAWRAENEVSFEIAVNGDAVADAFGATSTPTWFFVDAEGTVRFRGTSSDPDDPVFDLVAADLLGIDPEDCDVALC